MRNLVAIIAGDPESINSEIIGKAWKKRSLFKKTNIFLIGNYNLIRKQFKILKIQIKTKKINNLRGEKFEKKLLIYDIPINTKKSFKIAKKVKSKYVINSFNVAIKLVKEKKISGFVNCSINKDDIFKNKNFGVTEFLAKKMGVFGNEAMLIYNKNLAVSPITTHIKLKNVSKNISKIKILKKIIAINKFYFKNFKIKPKIGVIGLNPHNYEFRKNSEENKIIIPAINLLKKKGVLVVGPISADTAFINYKKKGFNVLVGMYHDQVLPPFKALFKFNAINITAGLPFIRVSPDHGTSADIIRKNLANPTSLIESIKFFDNKNVKA